MNGQEEDETVVDLENIALKHIRKYRAANDFEKHYIACNHLRPLYDKIQIPRLKNEILKLILDALQRQQDQHAESEAQGTRMSGEVLQRTSIAGEKKFYTEVSTRISPVVIFYCVRRRNAWHGTRSLRYYQDCMHSTLESAQKHAESQRGPGNVFIIRQIPALRVDVEDASFLFAEIDTNEPLLTFQANCKTLDTIQVGERMVDIFNAFVPFVRDPRSGNDKIIIMRTDRDLYLCPITKPCHLQIWRSKAVGVEYYLDWEMTPEVVSSNSVFYLSGK